MNEPWLAVLWSWVWSGAGHIYAGAWRRGAFWMIPMVFLWAGGLLLFLHPSGSVLGAVVVMGIALCGHVLCAIDAHRTARRRNDPESERARKEGRDPWMAVVLSILLPGAGHFYLRRWLWGVAILALFVAGVNIIPKGIARYATSEALRLVAACAAYAMTPRRIKGSLLRAAGVCMVVIVWGALLEALTSGYFLGGFRFTGKSMSPAIQPGDRVLVRRLWSHRPQRGEVVLMEVPDTPGRGPRLLRVVATEGDIVDHAEDGLRVNGEIVAAPHALLREAPPSMVRYPCQVPPDHVFLVYDRSDIGLDSRLFGTVTRAHIRGVASKILWPLNRSGPIQPRSTELTFPLNPL